MNVTGFDFSSIAESRLVGLRTVFLVVSIPAILCGQFFWAALCLAGCLSGNRRSQFCFLASFALVELSFHSSTVACVAFCLSPALYAWRRVDKSVAILAIESLMFGTLCAWYSTSFLDDDVWPRIWIVRLFTCVTYGLQLTILAGAAYFTRKSTPIVFSTVVAGVALAVELLQQRFGVIWPVMGLYVTMVNTPIVQWVDAVGILGLTFLGFFMNCQFACGGGQIAGIPCAGLGILMLGLLWSGGKIRENLISCGEAPISALLVQPNVQIRDRDPADTLAETYQRVDRITRDGLAAGGPVDLVIWPETSAAPCIGNSESLPVSEHASDDRSNVVNAASYLLNQYATPILYGTLLHRPRSYTQYGLTVHQMRTHNAAVLARFDQPIQVYEKLVLVPLKEGLPDMFDCQWVRHTLLPIWGFDAPLTPGEKYCSIRLRKRDGTDVILAVVICYESLYPQLPQYAPQHKADLIVHLIYDGYFVSHPEWLQRHLSACRARSIETRTWSYVCSACSGSALIDPAGRFLRQLPETSGYLRCERPVQATKGGLPSHEKS